jgi:hypothetical protein
MPGERRPADSNPPAVEELRLGLFAVALSVLLTLFLLLFRIGLPTPLLPLLVGPAIVAVAVLPPQLWNGRVWVGPLCVLGLFAGCLVSALGLVGIVVLDIAAVASVLAAIRRIAQSGSRSPARLLAWIGLLAAAGLLSTLLIHGYKYLNFVADQLQLWGRTDGDIIFHGAITNAYRYFHFPSTGIDGLHWLRYHTGGDALGALIAAGSGSDAVLALLILRTQVLFPLLVFGVALSALTLGRLLLPGHRIRAFAGTAAAIFVALLLQAGSNAALVMHNDPLFLSGVIVVLLAPAVVVELTTRGDRAKLALAIAVLAIPVLGVAKISTGALWCAFVGYLVLRTVGPRRAAFWITGGAMVLLFGLTYYVASDPANTGAVWFGTPFFVEYAFSKGNYLYPLLAHAYPLAALLGLLVLAKEPPSQPRRVLMEAIIVAALAANVVGIVLQIPSGDGVFFFLALNWLVLPPLAMLIAALPHLIGRLAPTPRRVAVAASVLLASAACVDAGARVDDKAEQAISATALLHTGDLSYYASDKRRAWRADSARALKEIGLFALFRQAAPTPRSIGLRDALVAAKREDPAIAVYIRPQSDFWNLVVDCDGRSVWTMAVAGVPMIDGYVPVQADCQQEFAITGYGTPPAVRKDFSDAEVCERAVAEGITDVLIVETVDDRSRDRRLSCEGRSG